VQGECYMTLSGTEPESAQSKVLSDSVSCDMTWCAIVFVQCAVLQLCTQPLQSDSVS